MSRVKKKCSGKDTHCRSFVCDTSLHPALDFGTFGCVAFAVTFPFVGGPVTSLATMGRLVSSSLGKNLSRSAAVERSVPALAFPTTTSRTSQPKRLHKPRARNRDSRNIRWLMLLFQLYYVKVHPRFVRPVSTLSRELQTIRVRLSEAPRNPKELYLQTGQVVERVKK